MKSPITREDAQLILQALNVTQIRGLREAQAVLTVAAKLHNFLESTDTEEASKRNGNGGNTSK